MAAVAPLTTIPNANQDTGRPGQQLLPGYVVKLLKTLKIPFGTDRTMSGVDVDPTLNLISHIIDCLGALRDVNKVYRAKGSLAARSVGTRVLYGYTSELGNILLDAITFDPPADLTDSCVYYAQIAGSILNVFPEIAAQVTPSTGKVLLHHTALKTSAVMSTEAIKMVLKAFPAGAWTADRTGALPLHWVTHNANCNQAMVSSLIAANPKGPWVADVDGYLPLHWAVNQDEPNVDVVAALVAANPSAASKACNKGSLPVHWCVNRDKVHMGVLRALIQVHPDGVRTFDKTGWLPLHQCVNRSNITIEAMQQLIELYPQSLQCPNSNGQLPLHRALDQSEPNLDAVHILLQAFPGAAKVADDEGYLPLHLALDCARPNVSIATLLLENYPEGAFHKSKDGLLPMHCIISAMHPVVEIIQQLLQIFPDSCESMAVDVIPVDENADPETWQGEWIEKRWTPLSRAIDRGMDAVVILFRDALNGNKPESRAAPRPPSTATNRTLQPQSQPPIHNLSHLALTPRKDDQANPSNQDPAPFPTVDPGPSTSSIEGTMRNRLILGGTLDMDEDGQVQRAQPPPTGSSPSRGIATANEDGATEFPPLNSSAARLVPLSRPPSQGGIPPPVKDRAPGGLRGQATPGSDLRPRDRDRHQGRDEDRESRHRSRSKMRHRDRDRERDRESDREYRERESRHRSRRSDRERERGRDSSYYDDDDEAYERPRRSLSRNKDRERERSGSRHRDRDRERDRKERERDTRRPPTERIYEENEFDYEEPLSHAPHHNNQQAATNGRSAPNEPPPKSMREATNSIGRTQSGGGRQDDPYSRSREFTNSHDAQDAAIELDHLV